MADRCKKCGACKECGATKDPVQYVPYPVYPYYAWWGVNQPYKQSPPMWTSVGGGTNSAGGSYPTYASQTVAIAS